MTHLMLYMNAAGGIFFLLHMILQPIEKKYFPSGWHTAVNRINLMLFMIPVPAICSFMRRFLYSSHSKWIRPYEYSGKCTPVRISDHTYLLLPRLTVFWRVLFLLWFVAALFLFARFLFERKKFCKQNDYFKKCVAEVEKKASQKSLQQKLQNEMDVIGLVQRAQEEMKISRKIQVYVSDAVISPHVSGIFHPSLYLPSVWNVPGHVYYLAIKHELAHIQNKDLLFHTAAYAARIIYWYNPVIYLLSDQMDNCDELSADACACRASTKDERIAYGNAVLDLLSDTDTQQYGVVKKFGLNTKQKKNLKERMEALKNIKNKRYKPLKLILLSCSVFFVFMVSMVPALAYDLPSTYTDEYKEHSLLDTVWYVGDSMDEEFENEKNLYLSRNLLDFSKCSIYFVDEDDVIFEAGAQVYAACRHKYSAGTAYGHDLQKDVGCIITVFKAKRCSKCGDLIKGEGISSFSYKVCPH